MIPQNNPIKGGGSQALPPLFMVTGLFPLLYAFTGPSPNHLLYNRSKILYGEIWRFITAHITHTDLTHLTINSVAFVVIALLYRAQNHRDWQCFITDFCTCAITLSAGIYLLMPDIIQYCGLSGLLNSLLVIALHRRWQIDRQLLWPIIAVASVCKAGWEMSGPALLDVSQWPPLPEAHMLGLGIGTALVIFRQFWQDHT